MRVCRIKWYYVIALASQSPKRTKAQLIIFIIIIIIIMPCNVYKARTAERIYIIIIFCSGFIVISF